MRVGFDDEAGTDVERRQNTASGFVSATGSSVVNVIVRAEEADGTARPRDPDEVSAVHWRTPTDPATSDDVPPFTREYVELAEADRRSRDSDE